MKFTFIREHDEEFPIRRMCRVLEVSRSGYYAWLKRPESRRSRKDRHLKVQIRTIFMKNKERYEALRALSPVDAVQAWLDFKFGIDDEPAMLEAIRRDSRIRLSDEEIIDTIQNAMNEELGAQACLGRLTGMA